MIWLLKPDHPKATEFAQFRLLIHTAAYWLMLGLRGLAPRTSFWRNAQFDTIRLCLIKIAGRVTEMVTRIKIALPTAYPYQIGFAMLAGRLAKLQIPAQLCFVIIAGQFAPHTSRRNSRLAPEFRGSRLS
jgi:hypothetical protein